MKRDAELFKRTLEEIEKATWYRQRFDACPHFMFFLGEAHISSIQHTQYPFGQRIAYAGFSHNRADWYHALEELEYTAAKLLEASKTNPCISEEIISAFLPSQEAFYEACEKLRETDLTMLADTELLRAYDDFAIVYTKKLNSSPLIDGFALSTDTIIAAKIKTFLESKGLGEKFVEYFAVLTAPTFLSFLQAQEIALLHVAKQIAENRSNESALLEQHQRDYFWIRNNYVKDSVMTIKDFEKELEQYKDVDVDTKIKEIEELAVQQASEKERLIAELELPHEIQTLLKITDDFNEWQDERKKGTFWATHYLSRLLQEFSRRTDYTLEQLKYALRPEMGDVLTRTLDGAVLNKRIEYCMILWTLDTYDVTTDSLLIEQLDRIGTGEIVHAQELKGFTASRGKVSGTVKIIESVEEMHKVETGDILVAVMTRPDYLPAMQKAAAFVTDEGGITCHAAIVAREMKKPCIIGTKIATKVFKDGDMVEVDAEAGIVRKL